MIVIYLCEAIGISLCLCVLAIFLKAAISIWAD